MLNLRVVMKLFKFSSGFRKNYIVALIINAFTMIRFSFLIGFSIQWVTDSAIAGDFIKLKRSLIFAVIAFLVNAILYFLEGYLMISSVEKISAEIERELLKRVMHLPVAYLSSKHSGDLQSRLTSDLSLAKEAISFTLVDPINFGTLGIVNLTLIALINLELALICILLVIIVVVINALFLKPIEKTSSRIQESIALATEKFLDIIRGIPVIKIFNLQNWIYNQYNNESRALFSWQGRLNKTNSVQRALNELINCLCTFGILGIGAVYLSNDKITTGALLAIARYASTLVFAFTGFGMVLSEVARSIEGAKRALEILDLPTEESEVKLNKAKGNELEALSFENVSFSYEDGRIVVEEFNEKILPGEVIALVGPSGAGKSTILKFIAGIYPYREEHGKVYLFGRDINEYTIEERRSYISYVPQNSYLFSGTIRENIVLGKPNASEEEIIKAAIAAKAHDFIMKLPKGYESEVGENGFKLSSGEKQRIAIARALVKDAPIILLDEPTSSLDGVSESEIQQALNILIKGKTVIVAAHRLSTVENADRIIVLENGRVLEKNTHGELMKFDSKYSYYYKLMYS